MKKWLKWLWSFFKIGCIGFGGGTSLIPVIEQEMVNNQKEVTKEEYDSAVLAGSITPGALTVKISAGVGRIAKGIKGMMLSAICMALPGVLMTILLLACMNMINSAGIKQIELVSIGITAFILYMLTKYINGTVDWAKKNKKINWTIIIMCVVFLLCSGSSISKICKFFGLEVSSYLSISTTHILAISFFILAYVGNKRKILRVIISIILSVLYILFVSKAQIMSNIIKNYFICIWSFRILQLIMIVLSVYGIVSDNGKKEKLNKVSFKHLVKEESAWILLLAICSLPALFMVPSIIKYLGNGLLSSIISFGGGDAYLTVADGMFVSTGMIPESYFYGFLVTIVNVLPGSTLCKTLSGIGYYIGYTQGGIIPGLVASLAGFACSIVGSCSTISLVQFFFDRYEKIDVLQKLKTWIKTIISGLLGTVILSLVYHCLVVAKNYGGNGLIVLIELLVIYILNIRLEKKFRIGTWASVIISCVVSLGIGNIIM